MLRTGDARERAGDVPNETCTCSPTKLGGSIPRDGRVPGRLSRARAPHPREEREVTEPGPRLRERRYVSTSGLLAEVHLKPPHSFRPKKRLPLLRLRA